MRALSDATNLIDATIDVSTIDVSTIDVSTIDASTLDGPTTEPVAQDASTPRCTSGQTLCNGACVDLRNDSAHCGACGVACALPRATARCFAGQCEIARCETGFGDCDSQASNGCEVSFTTNAAHCGGCGRGCGFVNGGSRCVDAGCVMTSCTAALGDCDGDQANGCEITLRSNLHCGACGNACDLAHATAQCPSGLCEVVRCDLGFANCDGRDLTGCEADLATNPAHCGACGTACASHEVCVRGRCASPF
ncbi:MAG: hypothetical protein JNK72_11880 [Myxococcales bacterium]|nr:hypothetical protein [Myxococcales bacterium]